MMSNNTFTAYIEYDPETKLYVGIVPSLPGAHTQGVTLDELHHNLEEVVRLCLEELHEQGEEIVRDTFVGIQQVAVVI